MITTFSVLLFLAVALLAIGIVFDRRGVEGRALADRLRLMDRSASGPKRIDVRRDLRLSALPWLDRLLRANAGQHLELLLYQAGMSMRAGGLVLLIATFAMAGSL